MDKRSCGCFTVLIAAGTFATGTPIISIPGRDFNPALAFLILDHRKLQPPDKAPAATGAYAPCLLLALDKWLTAHFANHLEVDHAISP